MRRLTPGRVAAQDGALDAVGCPEPGRHPHDVLALPGGAVGARVVPVLRLLPADELQAACPVEYVGADQPPGVCGPAGIVYLPTLPLTDAALGSLDERP